MSEEMTFAEAGEIRSLGLKWWQTALTWLLRIAVGGTFIFSGIVKAIDPWGTLYKLQDYTAAIDLFAAGQSLLLTFAFILFILEFMTGVFLVTGSFRRFSPVMVLLFMAVMLPLTLWIAIANPVADCGCFGDAWVISNWATFWKNVVITLAAVWLLIYNRRVHWVITPALQWVSFVATGIYAMIIGLTGYTVQPLVDFRDYKVGGPLITADAESETEHFVFIYEKDGEQKEFAETDSLPDESDGWQFVERRQLPAKPAKAAGPQRDLRIWSTDGEEDVTEEVMPRKGETLFVLMMPTLENVSIASTWKINSLKQWADEHATDFYAVVAASEKEIEEWQDLSMADYPIYSAEDTSIKEAVRGNPAVIYLTDGKIVWKSTLGALRGDDFMDAGEMPDAMSMYRDCEPMAKRVTAVYMLVLAVLTVMSFMPKAFSSAFRGIRPLFRRRKSANHPQDTTHDDNIVE